MFSKIKLIALGSLAATAGAIGLQAPASAAPMACATTPYAAATVFSTTTPFACQLGDKIFKDFKNGSNLTSKTLKFEQLGDLSYAINIANPNSGITTMDFTVEVTNPGFLLSEYFYNKFGGGGAITTQSVTPTGTLTELAFATSVTLANPTSGTRVLQFYLSQDVPGPLPLAGAAIAFGYSRKLRNRARRFA